MKNLIKIAIVLLTVNMSIYAQEVKKKVVQVDTYFLASHGANADMFSESFDMIENHQKKYAFDANDTLNMYARITILNSIVSVSSPASPKMYIKIVEYDDHTNESEIQMNINEVSMEGSIYYTGMIFGNLYVFTFRKSHTYIQTYHIDDNKTPIFDYYLIFQHI